VLILNVSAGKQYSGHQLGRKGLYMPELTLIQREKSDEILDIRFNTPEEAVDYAIAHHLFIIVTDDGCDGWN